MDICAYRYHEYVANLQTFPHLNENMRIAVFDLKNAVISHRESKLSCYVFIIFRNKKIVFPISALTLQ